MRIFSHILKRSSTQNYIFCAVNPVLMSIFYTVVQESSQKLFFFCGGFQIFQVENQILASNSVKNTALQRLPLCEKYSCSVLFWSVFSSIRTEYGDLLCKSPYSVLILENTDQKNSEKRYFLRSVFLVFWFCLTHFSPIFHFCTPWKRQKTKGFVYFCLQFQLYHHRWLNILFLM